MTTEEELQVTKLNLENVKHDYNTLIRKFDTISLELLDQKVAGTKLTIKQNVLHQLVMSSQNAFPHWFSAEGRWNKAEELYKEGVKRGHYPNE